MVQVVRNEVEEGELLAGCSVSVPQRNSTRVRREGGEHRGEEADGEGDGEALDGAAGPPEEDDGGDAAR